MAYNPSSGASIAQHHITRAENMVRHRVYPDLPSKLSAVCVELAEQSRRLSGEARRAAYLVVARGCEWDTITPTDRDIWRHRALVLQEASRLLSREVLHVRFFLGYYFCHLYQMEHLTGSRPSSADLVNADLLDQADRSLREQRSLLLLSSLMSGNAELQWDHVHV